ncbi:MAG: ImmA/IrrE family metallo-endopeptidase [Candidatus Aegiribacteria sp.]|nr:ImmA/IrrE family metallo-endopeptidase [Candidatus Aegiribacteria sp.]
MSSNSIDNKVIGDRVRNLRNSWTLTQKQLAEVLHLRNAQTVSYIENGTRALRAYELAVLAEYFHLDIDELLNNREKPAVTVQWRSSVDNTLVAQEEALFLKRCRSYSYVESVTNSTSTDRVPQKTDFHPASTKYETVSEWARHTRNALDLGDTPALSLQRTLTREWGVKIFWDNLECGSAACVKDSFGAGVLLNAKEPYWRQNFSLGHELFHLMTWSVSSVIDSLPETVRKRNETLAEIFSSSLLMPEESLRIEFNRLIVDGKIRWYDLMMLARRYDVSTIALLWRLANLGMMDKSVPEHFKSSDELRSIDKDLDRDDEPESKALPQRYTSLAYKAYNDGEISLGKLAHLLETTIGELDIVLADYGIDLNSDVYETTLSTS